MSTELSKAGRVLASAFWNNVMPELRVRGFSEIQHHKEPIPIWHLNRPRADGGYDVISICFDEKHRPLFDAVINVVDRSGVVYPWGEVISAPNVTAITLLKRVHIQRIGKGVLPILLPRWFGHTWFGFTPQNNAEVNQHAAEESCNEFIACLEQAERWWRTRELGSNLVEANVGAIMRDPNASESGEKK